MHSIGAMSRADLARILGLNRSSSGQIVAELTESGLVREVDYGKPNKGHKAVRTGRPGICLELIPEAAFFLGIEIGVEHLSAVMIDMAGAVRSSSTRAFDTPRVALQVALKAVIELTSECITNEQLSRCQGLGVSVPAHVRSDGFVIFGAILGWKDIPLGELVRKQFSMDIPVAVENDANAFAIGDAYKHGQSGVTLFLDMETGVGGGILIDGKLFRGGHGLAGEIGHTLVPGSNGRKLEQIIGRDSLVAQFQKSQKDDKLDLKNFIDAVRDRLPSAVEIAEEWAQHLAYALLQACRLIDPQRIVLGGSVAPLFTLVAARVKAHMAAGQTVPFPNPEITVDQDVAFGSAFGAACMMHQKFFTNEIELLPVNQVSWEGGPGRGGQEYNPKGKRLI
jgi:predicted NBD/HSP70 family sugar kinase